MRKRLPKIALVAAIIAGAFWASQNFSRHEILPLIDRAGAMGLPGYILFAIAYAIWVAVGLPAALMSLSAAIAFGFWRAFGPVFVGANLGAALGFFVARYIARDWTRRKIAGNKTLANIERAVANEGWKIVFLTRLPPISPFALLNYAYGVTSVRFSDYATATALGMLPGSITYMYFGSLLGEAVHGGRRERTRTEWAVYIAGFVLTIVVSIYLVRVAQRALAERSIASQA